MKKADIALVGLAVMGENLVMNMESKGFTVAVYNRTTDKVKNFVEGRAAGKNIIGCYSIQELVDSLAKPRKVGFIHVNRFGKKVIHIILVNNLNILRIIVLQCIAEQLAPLHPGPFLTLIRIDNVIIDQQRSQHDQYIITPDGRFFPQ